MPVTYTNRSCQLYAGVESRLCATKKARVRLVLYPRNTSCPLSMTPPLYTPARHDSFVYCMHMWCSVVQCGVVWCGAVWCSVVQCGAVWCSVVQCGAARCSVVLCGAVWCSGVQWGAVWCSVVHNCVIVE